MAGIHIAAIVSAALALAAYGGFLLKGTGARLRVVLGVLLLLQLPMSAATFAYVRLPLDAWIRGWVADREAYTAITLLYAPITEEAAKLWPLLLPFVWPRVDRTNALRIAIALGLGFGIGEIAFLADRLAASPAIAALPWTSFGGFVYERLVVCLWHIAFTAVTVWAAARSPAWVPVAFIGSVALHFVGNFPIYLAARGALGLDRQTWQEVLLAWPLLYAVLLAIMLALMARSSAGL
ncbi:MAG: hypothetical protein KIT16_20715, partial [Rhodospirillaceae bacterium]|nr:hypothetical protein [Rhodospirillaceae bacterium]